MPATGGRRDTKRGEAAARDCWRWLKFPGEWTRAAHGENTNAHLVSRAKMRAPSETLRIHACIRRARRVALGQATDEILERMQAYELEAEREAKKETVGSIPTGL